MKTINISDLKFLSTETIGDGNFGLVKKCEYDGKIYAYKELYEPNKILTPVNIYKFECLSKLNQDFIKSPKILVESEKRITSYLTDFAEGKVFSKLIGEKDEVIIDALKMSQENLEIIHKLGIVHCDIHLSNIINSIFIDFDNSYYKNIKPSQEQLDIYANSFIDKYGLSVELDIAMFNLLTYQMLLGFEYGQDALNAIYNGEFGMFDTPEQRAICENLLLYDSKPTQKYLINTLR